MNYGKNSISRPRKSLPTLNKPLCEQISNSRKPTAHNTPPKVSRTPLTPFQQSQLRISVKRQDTSVKKKDPENKAGIPENLTLGNEDLTKNSCSQKDLDHDPDHYQYNEDKNFNFEGGFKNLSTILNNRNFQSGS
jgi:hypothetical protein